MDASQSVAMSTHAPQSSSSCAFVASISTTRNPPLGILNSPLSLYDYCPLTSCASVNSILLYHRAKLKEDKENAVVYDTSVSVHWLVRDHRSSGCNLVRIAGF